MPSRFLGGPDGRIAITVLVVFAERKNGKNAARLLRTFPRQLTPGRVAKVVPGCGCEPVTGRLAVEAALRRRRVR